ncbi:nucleotide cyclase [Suillus clintonianus]|uniref:nucleotide cyclase n=1 Tax=Suillus clintonianus TaxID=1904413 RepID=UPI001B86AAC6|nr:nucleotide cyclase [Suillus clintonianus]KAG2120378.1 nucleotide cyclase [Suillus clintonianus]
MYSTANFCASRYGNRWGFSGLNRNFSCKSKYFDLLENQKYVNRVQRKGNEDGGVLSSLSQLSHLPGFGSKDLPSTHHVPEKSGKHHVHTHRKDENGMSRGIVDTIGKHEHLGELMPDYRARQKDKVPSAVPEHAKESLAHTIARLEREVPAPTGHVCLVFTDIRNSTQLWDKNSAMSTAIHLHNDLLLLHLLFCGGYIVKTEGDAFMCSFPNTMAAVWWCVTAQLQLLHAPWPEEILNSEEGKEVYDEHGTLLSRGLSVRMGIHCGAPACEEDAITHRMDYFGSMVNRSARICASALGGQIMCSADVVREIDAGLIESGAQPRHYPAEAIDAVRKTVVVPVGEVKLKGLETPEIASLLYPSALLGRQDLDASGLHLSAVPSPSTSTPGTPAACDESMPPSHKLPVTTLLPMMFV